MDEKQLIPYRPALGPVELGELMARSGYFSDAKGAAQAAVKVLAGMELGFGPVASMMNIHIIQGRVTMSANLIAAAVKKSGRYDYKVRQITDKLCEIEFLEHGQAVGLSTFSWADAEVGKLTTGDNWRKWPRNMLFARAISNGAKWYCADVFAGGVYTPDELGAVVDGETGEIIEAAPPPAIEPPAVAPRSAPKAKPTEQPFTAAQELLRSRFAELGWNAEQVNNFFGLGPGGSARAVIRVLSDSDVQAWLDRLGALTQPVQETLV